MLQECVIMNMSVTYCYAATRVHEAAMSLIRYWFVRSSLQVEVQETFKKDHFIYKIILIPQEIFILEIFSIHLQLFAACPLHYFPVPNEIRHRFFYWYTCYLTCPTQERI